MTAAVGPFFSPLITTSHIASNGGFSSHGIEIKGESQRTIDEGSSKRISRLSNLLRVSQCSVSLWLERSPGLHYAI